MVRNISEAKAELSALVEEVQKGGEVILAMAGKPVAKKFLSEAQAVRVFQAQWRDRFGLLRISMNFPMI
jgi:hypothetical protein